MKNKEIHSKWQPSYLWMLLANALYIIVFYLIMKIFI